MVAGQDAGSTPTFALAPVGVLFGVLVAVDAMRPSPAFPSSNILVTGDRLKVGRIAARPVAAGVVEFQSVRDRADSLDIKGT